MLNYRHHSFVALPTTTPSWTILATTPSWLILVATTPSWHHVTTPPHLRGCLIATTPSWHMFQPLFRGNICYHNQAFQPACYLTDLLLLQMSARRAGTRSGRVRRAPARYTPTTTQHTPLRRVLTEVTSPNANTPSTSRWVVTPQRAPSAPREVSFEDRLSQLEGHLEGSMARPGSTVNDDLEARIQALEHSLQIDEPQPRRGNNGESTVPSVIGTTSLPLYSSLPREVVDIIDKDEYVEMKRLVPGQLSSSSSKDRPIPLTSWVRAYLRFMSQKVRSDPTAMQDLLVHMDTVVSLAEDRHQWESYDQEFRRQLHNVGYPYSQTRVELYYKALTRPNRPQHLSNPRRQQGKLEVGTCFRFHTPNQRCETTNCPYKHRCPSCNGRHPQYLCSSRRQGDDQKKEDKKPKTPDQQARL